ncbi:MAG: 3-deoxy-manno-octulosonate cytidylyltransferase [Elusimicrobiota bacterium]
MKCIAVIPARISSTRLKEKPLVDVGGKPLIQRVYEKALKLNNVAAVVIATDSEKIVEAARMFGADCRLTPSDLKSGSDRVYYTCREFFKDAELIVNLQGDEPFIDEKFVDRLIEDALQGPDGVYSAYSQVARETADDSSVVKVVVDRDDYALYFSRALIPGGAEIYKKHLGIYIWRADMLEKFTRTAPTPLEKTEKLEQLRVLETGGKIKMKECCSDSLGIDTVEDLELAIRRLDEN